MKTKYWFVTRHGGEEALVSELQRTIGKVQHTQVAAGIIAAETSALKEPILAFCSQTLVNPQVVRAASVNEWAQAIVQAATTLEVSEKAKLRLHIYPETRGYSPAGERRAELITAATNDLLKRKQRAILRRVVSDPAVPWHSEEGLLQVLLRTPTEGVISAIGDKDRKNLEHALSTYPAGYVRVPVNKEPPSTAYRKVVEAQMRFGRSIEAGETCVDLGACPGGWTWIAAHQEAKVIAVDRSPLRADLMRDKRVQFVKGDAFKFIPEKPVDWMLSDVIAFPGRSIDLMEEWVREKRCRHLIVTVKFRGNDDYPELERLKKFLVEHTQRFLLQQLSSNKNEVTAMAEVAVTV